MNHEDFNEEVRRERIESDAAARTLEDEIADLESDIRDLDKIIADQLQENARLVSTNNLLRRLMRLLDAEHKAGVKMRRVPDTRSPEFIDAYRPWADAHDRTELAK